ncbi:insulin-like growth factor binding proteinn-terminal [Anaeramoeba flamelloides]|uniref:Insulin-like growth factor binding proteinn-terminal n=1 Tax=Anaeramoeba flamelloides TaxID=1746091 RepID=A0AAV8A9J0_9EUKA|nr:insulin-like growth factor binding proteinn-terminal [Anaeramoeba flamelloides]
MKKRNLIFLTLILVLLTSIVSLDAGSLNDDFLMQNFFQKEKSQAERDEDTFRHHLNVKQLPAYIYENFGQTDEQVKYICHVPFQGHFHYTNEEIIYNNGKNWISFKVENGQMNELVASEELKSKTHFQHAKLMKSNLKNYKSLIYKNILNDIDLEFTTGANNVVKSAFYLKKGRDINLVKLNYEIDSGLNMLIEEDGTLLFETKSTYEPVLRESKPIFFQNGKELNGEYKFDQNKKQIAFKINDPNFKQNKPLIIDPNYATYMAGSSIDVCQYGSTDSNHCGLLTGYTQSSDFPLKNEIQGTKKGSQDVFFIKTCDGKTLEWSTYLGSTNEDNIYYFILDSEDNIYATGYAGYAGTTVASRFPTTSGSYHEYCSSSSVQNTFVTKIKHDGSELLWSTFLCSDAENWGRGIALRDGYIFIGGHTDGAMPLPTETGGTYDCDDADIDSQSFYVAKLSIDGTGPMLRSRCFGGNNADVTTRMIGDSDYLYYIGYTKSSTFPTTPGVVMEESPSGTSYYHWFMGKLDINDFSTEWSSYFGGSKNNYPTEIALKSTGEIWISGKTSSTDFPTTEDAQQVYYDDKYLHFAGTFTLFSADGKEMLYSSYLGGQKAGSSDIWTIGVGSNDEVVIGMTYPPYPDEEFDYDFGDNAGVIVYNSDVTEILRLIKVGTFRVMGIGFYQGDAFNFTIVGSSTSEDGYTSILETTEGAFRTTQIDENDLFAIHIYTKCDKGSYGVDQGCELCEMGFYADEEGMTRECKQCPYGTFNNDTGLSECYDCQPGWYGNEKNATTCYTCDMGRYSSEWKSRRCDQCPEGQFNTEEGLSYCEECGVGEYNSDTGLTECEQCEMGEFANATGMSFCHECQPGTYNHLRGQDQCFECDIGKHQDSAKATSCKDCLPGTFQDQKGQARCRNCTGGTFNSKYTATKCETCDKGTFNPGDGSTKCFFCDYGDFGNETGLGECYKCSTGSYSINKGSTKCDLCEYGTYSDILGMTSSTCIKCPMGTYNSKKGASSIEGCIECPQGTFSETVGGHSDSVCQMCPKGTYNSKTGSQSSDDCTVCPEGTIANGIKATTCLDCPVGQEPDQSQNECQDCQAGFYSDQEGKVCDPCVAGEFNNEQGLTYCIKCASLDICLGNNTCEGERDPEYNCARCKSGYFLLNDQCQGCPPPVQAILIISSLVIILILIYIFRGKINNFMKSTRNPIKDITFTFFQILAGIIALDLTWPIPVRSNLRFVSSVFNLKFDTVVSPECYKSFTFYDTWLIIFLIPLGGTLIAICFWFYYLKRYKLEPERLERRKIRLVHHYSIILKYMYLPLVKLSVDPFDFTYQEEDEKYYLDSNPKLSPSDEKWQSFLPLFIISVVLYVVGIPIFFFVVVYKAKKANFTEWYEKRFGWMYRYFKPNRYWWELVEIFFKFLVIITAIMFNVNSTGQAWFVLGLLTVLIILVLILRPYKGEYPRYVAEDRLVVGLLLIAFSIVTLAIDFLKSIPFFILFPIGFIIAFDGIKENLRKFLVESKLIRAEIQMQAVELKNNNINLDDFITQVGEEEKKSQKKNKHLMKQINDMNKGLSTMKKTIKRTQQKISIITQENENFEEKNKIFWEENEQIENKVKEHFGENVDYGTDRSDDIDN